MTTFTREWLQQTIADFESTRDDAPFGLDEDDAKILAALKLALAAMQQESVGEVVLGDFDDCGDYPDAKVVCIATQGQAGWNNFRNGTVLYAEPRLPQPSVMDERAAFNAWNNEENLPIAGVGAKNAAWLAWQARAAMLQGKAELVSNRDELPPDEIECDICGHVSADPEGRHYCCEDNSND